MMHSRPEKKTLEDAYDEDTNSSFIIEEDGNGNPVRIPAPSIAEIEANYKSLLYKLGKRLLSPTATEELFNIYLRMWENRPWTTK